LRKNLTLVDIGKFLKNRREERKISKDGLVEESVNNEEVNKKKPSWLDVNSKYIAEIERGNIELITSEHLHFLSKLYVVDPLRMFRVLPKPREELVYLGKESYFEEEFSDPEAEGEALYSIPKEQLTTFDSLVFLTLKAGSQSRGIYGDHYHHGNEIVLVKEGQIAVQFRDKEEPNEILASINGKKYDIIQFDSRTPHLIANLRKEKQAKVFIVRKYEDIPLNIPGFPVLFGGFLKEQHRAKKQTLDYLVKKANQLKEKGIESPLGAINQRKLSDLENGRLSFQEEWLEYLTQLYDIDDVLMYGMLPEPRSGFVRLRKFKKAPKQSEEIKYFIPKYRLERSTDTFVRVKIAPGAKTEQHSHQGDEIIIVEKENITIHIPKFQITRDVNEDEIFHFDGAMEHFAKNEGSKWSEYLVIRKYNIPQKSLS